ncbi:hypothetical protein MRX96_048458 [Rhipicephalus microplus]
MGSAWLLATALCALITCCWAVAGPSGLAVEGKPEFAPYQDMGKCLSRGSTWYVFYRTVKEGAFGTNDRCLRDTQLSDSVGGKARFRFRFGDNHERCVCSRLCLVLTNVRPPGSSPINATGKLSDATEMVAVCARRGALALRIETRD